jgi:hypothetical protein
MAKRPPWWAIVLFVVAGGAMQALGLFMPLSERHASSLQGAGTILIALGIMLFLVRTVRRAR